MRKFAHKRIRAVGAALLSVLFLVGCSVNNEPPEEETAMSVTAAPASTPQTVSVDVSLTVTEKPTVPPAPTDTPSPVPTDTPKPNPYAGTWTILNRPFSLALRTDGTFTAKYRTETREGTYLFDDSEVTLVISESEMISLVYVVDADLLRYMDYELIRSDLIAETDDSEIPVSFENKNETVRVRVRGAVVEAEILTETAAQQYCFTQKGCVPAENSHDWFDVSDTGEPQETFRVFKYDGSYTLWVKDVNGNPIGSIDVTVASGYTYPIDTTGIEPVRIPLERLLQDNGTSVDQMNQGLASEAATAGIYTRQGVVTAGVSLISRLAKLGSALPYQGSGTYHAGREWGVNPKWGTKQRGSEKNYFGMHDVASIIWAYKQAGMNLYALGSVPINSLGESSRGHDNKIDYDRAESGDLIKNGRHYIMVIDRLDQNGDGRDDAYLVYEMRTPFLSVVVYPFSEIRKREFYSMDAFFAGTGRNQEKVNYWKDRFRIPSEDLPAVLVEAAEKEKLESSYAAFLKLLGF